MSLNLPPDLFPKAFSASPVSLALCTWGENRFVEVNDSFLRVLELARHEVVGRTLAELGLWPDPQERDRWLGLLAQKRPVREVECVFRARSGDLRQTLLSAEYLDHDDPMGGHYTLEVTSPGLERSLRIPTHFQRSIGKTVALRLRDIVTPEGERSERRLQGVLIAADDQTVTIQLNDAALTERVVPHDKIDRAKTVFVWGPAPKPGKAPKSKRADAPAEVKEDAS